ncbi:MAG: helix-turn-helix domain-containing protein [Desulfovibrionaceae bacterium]
MPKPKKKCDDAAEKWFEAALERIKKATGARTQVQLAEVLGVRQSSISDAKRRCSIPAEWFLKLYRSHGLDPDWLSDGVEPIYVNPAKGKIAADVLLRETPAPYGKPHSRGRAVSVSPMSGVGVDEPAWTPSPMEELSIPESYYRDGLEVVRMDNKAMEPLIVRDAFVGIDTRQKQHPDGDLCAVYFPHQGLLLRRVYFQNGEFVLRAESQEHGDITVPAAEMESHLVGRVIWVMQNYAPL